MGWFRSNGEKNRFEDNLSLGDEFDSDRQRLSKKQIRAARNKHKRSSSQDSAGFASDNVTRVKEPQRY